MDRVRDLLATAADDVGWESTSTSSPSPAPRYRLSCCP
jgi:hypothetical protein